MKYTLILIIAILSFSRTCQADTFTYDTLDRLTHVAYDDGSSLDYSPLPCCNSGSGMSHCLA